MTNLSIAIKEQRELLGLTQNEVAKKMSMSQQSYSIIEHNPSRASLEKMLQVSKILKFSFTQFLDECIEGSPYPELENNGTDNTFSLFDIHKELKRLTKRVERLIKAE